MIENSLEIAYNFKNPEDSMDVLWRGKPRFG